MACKILVVDDDPDICALARTYLRAEGHTVLVANDGFSCIPMAQREVPDLILLDLGLPAGDGVTVLKRLKSLSQVSDVPVLVVTSRDAKTWKDVVLESEAVGFLSKPFTRDEFLAAVRKCLGEPAQSDQGPAPRCRNCGHPVELPESLSPEMVEQLGIRVARAVLQEMTSATEGPIPV